MKKVLGLAAVAAVLLWGSPAMAAIGETWTLGIHHIDGQGSFTVYNGAGYGGPTSSGDAQFSGNAYGLSGQHSPERVYWELSGLGSLGNEAPATAELFAIEVYDPTAGGDDWHVLESQIRGVNGETFPIEGDIPWNGAFGTNHQYGSIQRGNPGGWVAFGAGPQLPESDDPNAGPSGTQMWMQKNGWMYVKWDGHTGDMALSAIRLTQITPEPAAAALLVLGAIPLLRRRNRRH